MSQNTHVPKFGNWDGSIPYTQYFEDARKGRSGKIINPNDPFDNPEAFSANMSPAQSPAPASYSEATKLKDAANIRREGNHRRTPSRGSDSSNYRVNRSPVRPSYKMNNRELSFSEGWSSSSNPFTSKSAGRLRMTSIEDDAKIKKGSAVPKFGDWDEKNPSSADGFTDIFNNVRKERQAQSTTVGKSSSDKTFVDYHGNTPKSSKGYWCFGWCKK
ncbi:RPM1-interacting protein 4-like [Zingiber officinale]|uniref:RPM1-interacting protein 4-like n=1 Tax=Zingiber officinale TaxID=94328 RepID=UPI001C4D7B60|nr:RPM1-interacting protein 4-like [Zingiber officinale]